MPLSAFEIQKSETDRLVREAFIRSMADSVAKRRERLSQLGKPSEAQRAKEEADRLAKEAWIQMMQRRERHLPK